MIDSHQFAFDLSSRTFSWNVVISPVKTDVTFKLHEIANYWKQDIFLFFLFSPFIPLYNFSYANRQHYICLFIFAVFKTFTTNYLQKHLQIYFSNGLTSKANN